MSLIKIEASDRNALDVDPMVNCIVIRKTVVYTVFTCLIQWNISEKTS